MTACEHTACFDTGYGWGITDAWAGKAAEPEPDDTECEAGLSAGYEAAILASKALGHFGRGAQ